MILDIFKSVLIEQNEGAETIRGLRWKGEDTGSRKGRGGLIPEFTFQDEPRGLSQPLQLKKKKTPIELF